MEHMDALVVGAGLSGIGAACRLRMECPAKSFIILEGRSALGGTWDLFRYPGVRSDSDMYTLGYRFRPWPGAKAIADGPAILNYIRETAAEFGVDQKIRYHHRVRRASWSSSEVRWTVEAETGPENRVEHLTCNFLYLCTGYYDYENGYTPEWEGVERFHGRIVHPQKWPADLDYEGKRVVVNRLAGQFRVVVMDRPGSGESTRERRDVETRREFIINLHGELFSDCLCGLPFRESSVHIRSLIPFSIVY